MSVHTENIFVFLRHIFDDIIFSEKEWDNIPLDSKMDVLYKDYRQRILNTRKMIKEWRYCGKNRNELENELCDVWGKKLTSVSQSGIILE